MKIQNWLKKTGWTLTAVAFWSGTATPTYAAYDRVVQWTNAEPIDLRSVSASHYASRGNLLDENIPDSVIESVIQDTENRISPDFRVPAEIKSSVEFWLRVYTQYTTRHAILFDEAHPEIVYEVLDFRDTDKRRRAVKPRINQKLAAYRRAFSRLASNPHPAHPTREEARILKALRHLHHRHSFRELAQNLHVQRGQRDTVIKGLLRAEPFFPKMELIFSKMGIPRELTRLCLVESSFNVDAVSRVGATGVWQFMLDSGREYLLIDSRRRIDERLSPLKATVAAGKLLNSNYQYLKNWPLAITAYNHGTARLPRMHGNRRSDAGFSAVARLFRNPCKKKGKLGYASRNYYPEFLAALYAEAYRTAFFGATPVIRARPLMYEELRKPQTALSVAMDHGVALQEFRTLNPDVKDFRHSLPRGFRIALPAAEDSDLGEILDKRDVKSRARARWVSTARRY